MRTLPVALLLVVLLGCGSETPTAGPAETANDNPSQPQEAASNQTERGRGDGDLKDRATIEQAAGASNGRLSQPQEARTSHSQTMRGQVDRDLKGHAAIEQAIRLAVGKPTGELTPDDLQKLAELPSLGRKEISDLEPLDGMTNLSELWLHDNQIADVTPLAGMTKLQTLILDDNQIVDVTPLAGLTGLTFLSLHDNPIRDLTPLGQLQGLEFLGVDNTQVEDLRPLMRLTNLKNLSIAGVQSLKPAQLSQLQQALPNCRINRLVLETGEANP